MRGERFSVLRDVRLNAVLGGLSKRATVGAIDNHIILLSPSVVFILV
jgi:hypothetical protein